MLYFLEGHGQSEGPRMHITDIRHYVRDVFQHIDSVKEKFPGLPVFIIGHSMVSNEKKWQQPFFYGFMKIVVYGASLQFLEKHQHSVGDVVTIMPGPIPGIHFRLVLLGNVWVKHMQTMALLV